MKRPQLDTRPNWHDPNMPVLRDYRMADGTKRTIVDPDYEHRYREHLMQVSENPSYKNDPTYNLKRKR